MIPKFTDSAIWKRVCSAHIQASELCSTDSSDRTIWNEEEDGEFSFKSAFEEVREISFSSYIYQQIWDTHQELKVKLLQWKIHKGILPISDRLSRFNIVLNPSICPLCRNDNDTLKHIFFHCSVSKQVWQYFLNTLDIVQGARIDYAHFLNWKIKVNKASLKDLFRKNIPGLICWFLWKTYTSIVWGDEGVTPNPEKIIFQIKLYTQVWISSISTNKIRRIDVVLRDEGLIPRHFKPKESLPKIIRWNKPKTNWKLNVDASYLLGRAYGGAILRDREGSFVIAISFPLQARSSLDAELGAFLYATKWAVDAGYEGFHVETDSLMALQIIDGNVGRRWIDVFQESTLMRIRNRISFGHVMREGNWVAHYLAHEEISSPVFYLTLDQLPLFAKRYFWMDFYGIPSIRE